MSLISIMCNTICALFDAFSYIPKGRTLSCLDNDLLWAILTLWFDHCWVWKCFVRYPKAEGYKAWICGRLNPWQQSACLVKRTKWGRHRGQTNNLVRWVQPYCHHIFLNKGDRNSLPGWLLCSKTKCIWDISWVTPIYKIFAQVT